MKKQINLRLPSDFSDVDINASAKGEKALELSVDIPDLYTSFANTLRNETALAGHPDEAINIIAFEASQAANRELVKLALHSMIIEN